MIKVQFTFARIAGSGGIDGAEANHFLPSGKQFRAQWLKFGAHMHPLGPKRFSRLGVEGDLKV
jgi:hypothetical protein